MPASDTMSRQDAAHLLCRTGFGGSDGELTALTGMTREAGIDAAMGFTSADTTPEGPDVGDGIVIEAVDGPGWWLTIDLRDTSLEGNRAEPWVEDLGDGSRVQGWCDSTIFTAAASVDQLHVAVQWFRDFVRDVEEPRWQELLAG
ncbi:MAG: Imm53 family immunity protein [Acidimicrobiales bacterium]|jgi:hypothetical protein|nr:Imm53 family immunity protein [Acidimicrobiales bacterium]